MPNENIIESIVYPGSQSVTCRIIYQLNGRTIKLEIKSDGFAPQSYAKACVFDGTSWKDLYAIPYALMRTPHELFYSPRFCGRDYKNLTGAALQLVLDEFSVDLDTLRTKAEAISFFIIRRNADFSGRQNRPGGPIGGIYDFRRTKERRNKISLPARQKTLPAPLKAAL